MYSHSTACEYCMRCPYGINIPGIFQHYNKCVTEALYFPALYSDGVIPVILLK